jgi:hypothetical protein
MTKAKTLIDQLNEVAVYRWVRGNSLSPENQKKALSMYVHRYTGEHKPNWVKDYMPNGKEYPVQHETDQDWLANTEFAIKKNGDFDGRVRYSRSSSTWPKNPELRRDI